MTPKVVLTQRCTSSDRVAAPAGRVDAPYAPLLQISADHTLVRAVQRFLALIVGLPYNKCRLLSIQLCRGWPEHPCRPGLQGGAVVHPEALCASAASRGLTRLPEQQKQQSTQQHGAS
jgi:hypothetical protein